jgi:putative ABC transport system permease protein
MFLNYLKIALRNIRRDRGFSAINIVGLATGMACCVLILLFVSDELSYDGYYSRAVNIYRMVASSHQSGEDREYVPLGAPYALFFEKSLPEVKAAVRFYPHRRVLVEHAEKKFFEERFFFSDPSVFTVFSFALLRGNPSTALTNPFSVVLTESMARKYFGDHNPVGESLKMDNEHIFRIDGVMEDVPPNSHFHFDFLASLETLSDLYGERFLQHPGYLSFYSYVLVQENTDPRALEAKFHDEVIRKYGERVASLRTIKLQPLKSIHLHSHLEGELEANSSMSFIYIYSAIALFVLLIAAFNFVNLSTARSAKRAQEVGMRKVLGAFRIQLVKQFLGEAVVFSLISLVLGVIIVRILLPLFNSLAGKEIPLDLLFRPSLLVGLAGIVFMVGILGGLYPAMFLSAFEPIRTIKGRWRTAGRSGSFRRFLVVFQFAISIALIIGTIVIRNQLHYMRSQDLGFDKEEVVVIPLHDPESRKSYEVIKEELLNNPSILATAVSSSVPGKQASSIAYRVEGLPDDQHISIDTFFVDYDFLETFGVEMAAGREFSQEFGTDEESAFILNETAVRELSWGDAIGKQIIWPSDLRRQDAIVKKGRVVGVVKDFHITSLHENIQSVLFQIRPSNFRFLSVRIARGNVNQSLAFLRDKWRQFSPAFPFEYSFLDEDFDKLYRADQKVGRIIGVFTTLALFVACLGLFGLASFAAEQRTKEIGVRKVLGASASGIFMLLSREFAKWVLIANIIAWPIAYFAMNRWLRNFAYRVTIGIDVFFLSALASLAIALFTVSYRSLKASVTNPVDSLRYE